MSNYPKARKEYGGCFPFSDIAIKRLLGKYYGRSFVVISSIPNSDDPCCSLLEQKINLYRLVYLPTRVQNSIERGFIIFPFTSKGERVDMYKLIEQISTWINKTIKNTIILKYENYGTYIINLDSNEYDFREVEAKEVFEVLCEYFKYTLQEEDIVLLSKRQPGSPIFEAYERVMKGELCMPLRAWENLY